MSQCYELWVISLGNVSKCQPESTHLSDFTVGLPLTLVDLPVTRLKV